MLPPPAARRAAAEAAGQPVKVAADEARWHGAGETTKGSWPAGPRGNGGETHAEGGAAAGGAPLPAPPPPPARRHAPPEGRARRGGQAVTVPVEDAAAGDETPGGASPWAS